MIAPEAGLSVSRQCALLGIARSSFYYRPRPEAAEELDVLKRLDRIFTSHPVYGSRRLQVALLREGISIGRRRVRRLMRKLGLWAVRPCRNRRAKSADLESSFYQWVAPRRARQPIDILRESAFQCDTHRCGRMRRAKQARLRPARHLVPLIWPQEIGRKLILLQRTSLWPRRRCG